MTTPLDAATQDQNAASHPLRTTWVAANAGSGKTRVLTDRVARLLLRKVDPQKILCLTYTKAAAAEMQARLFRRLGEWAMLDDATLRDALTGIGEKGAAFDEAALNRARTLFARALETPGGLKIQTIHAFCGHLLRRFPLEAGVSPNFTEIDDSQALTLRNDVMSAMAEEEPATLADVARLLTNEAGLGKLLSDVQKHRDAFARFEPDACAELLGIAPDLTRDDVMATLAINAPRVLIDRIRAAIAQNGSDNERNKKFATLLALPDAATPQSLLDALAGDILNKDGSRPKTPVTKAVQTAHPWILDALSDLQDTVLGTLESLRAIAFLDRARVMARFGQAFLARYAAAKEARGLLDFDDLIDRTRDMLTAYETTQWVLFRLDGGIAHILVDEAQDTSPRQWEVIEALSAGFADDPDAHRTLFVVGDQKQSIFGFQGAQPEQLNEKKEEFADRLAAANDQLQDRPLLYSFRSAAPILQLVDHVFADDPLDAFGQSPEHRFFDDKPGRVDVWPFGEKREDGEDGPWWQPIDRDRPTDPVIALADTLAAGIADLTQSLTPIPDGRGGWRRATAGDVLVLVRSRNRFFHRLIAQLKARGVPVAGADRLRIKSELAVKDLLSLLRFLDNPRDDLSLAETLRSPLFGVTEAQLFALAHGRDGLLWDALRHSELTELTARMTSLRNRVDFARPFELLETVLTVQGGRKRLIARLGPHCSEAVDELLSQALAFERSNLPTLGGFLAWIDARDVEIKRDMDAAGDEVRVMTIHGAKGLEAPIVVLADVSQRQSHQQAPQIQSLSGLPIWMANADDMPAAATEVEIARREAEDRENARLLYVALTRAESWLIVCGAGGKPDKRWFEQVKTAATGLATSTHDQGGPRIDHNWHPQPMTDLPDPTPEPDTIAGAGPDTPPTPFVHLTPLTPSGIDAPHALPGEPMGDIDAMARGSLIHDLIDGLADIPPDQRAGIAKRYLTGADWEEGALVSALSTLENPDLAWLFDPDVLSEVTITTGATPGQRPIFGRIDRLLVREKDVLAVDFKSNRVVPDRPADVPPGLLAQMGLYARALEAVYPGRDVRTAIVWTQTGQFMPLEHADVTAAAAMFQSLDPAPADP